MSLLERYIRENDILRRALTVIATSKREEPTWGDAVAIANRALFNAKSVKESEVKE